MTLQNFHRLSHLAARVIGTPLMIEPAKLDVILQVLALQESQRHAPPLLELPVQSAVEIGAGNDNGIAVIAIHGSLVKRSAGMDAMSGLTSYESIAAQLQAALDDSKIQGIVLEIDSPGGEACGVFDLADAIRAAGEYKPIYAVASDRAYSAAYALASSASRVYLSRTAGMGSIGVIAMHVDQSVLDAQQGLRYTPIFAGERKNDLTPHAPISDAARATLQGEVDRLYALFVDTVASNRRLNSQAVRDTQAGVFFAEAAIAAGLADALGTTVDAVRDLRLKLTGPPLKFGGRDPPLAKHLITATPTTPQNPESNDQVFFTSETSSTLGEKTMPETNSTTDDIAAMETPVTTTAAAATSTPTPPSAVAIADLCLLAGASERTAEFLARGVSEDVVRRELLAARAQGLQTAGHHTSEEIQSHVVPGSVQLGSGALPAAMSLDANPVVLAAKQRAA
jgi:capsid assembly protease